MIKFTSLLTAAALLTAGAAFADGHTSMVLTGKVGDQTYLMDGHKMTLYTFDKDTRDTSNCYADCAVKWPPLLAEAGAKLPKKYSLIKRKDGSQQVAYKGQPLYLWFKDTQPGEMTGDGVKGVWHTARP